MMSSQSIVEDLRQRIAELEADLGRLLSKMAQISSSYFSVLVFPWQMDSLILRSLKKGKKEKKKIKIKMAQRQKRPAR